MSAPAVSAVAPTGLLSVPADQSADIAHRGHAAWLVRLDAARHDWLDGADEPALPIIDAHHHLWDVARNPHPWLQQQPRIPFRYGDYGAICRDFLPADYAALTTGHRVIGQVTMEGEWAPEDPTGEARWMQALAAREGLPQAHAAQIWLDREDLPAVLAAYRALPLVRSVRHKPRSVPRAQHDARYAAPGSMRCPRWRSGYAQLQPAGLAFELQTPWWHLAEAEELARDFPAIPLILNHAGLPSERDAASLAAWGRALHALARWPNVAIKLSGIGQPGQAWTPALQQPVFDTVLAAFGPQRCAIASNFPVDGLCASLDDIFSGFKQLSRRLPRADRLALCCDTAVRLYRLREPAAAATPVPPAHDPNP